MIQAIQLCREEHYRHAKRLVHLHNVTGNDIKAIDTPQQLGRIKNYPVDNDVMVPAPGEVKPRSRKLLRKCQRHASHVVKSSLHHNASSPQRMVCRTSPSAR